MLRQVLLRSSASRLTKASSKRPTRRSLVHTNACKQEDVDEESAADSVDKKQTRHSGNSGAVDTKREHDHRTLLSFSVPQPQQRSAAVRNEFRSATAKTLRASSSLDLQSVNGAQSGLTAKDIEA